MQDSWEDKIRLFLLHRIPLATTLLLMLLFYVPINSLGLNHFRPAVGFICVYYWTLKRGYLFSYISAFLVGFITDVYSATPLGLNILMLMLLVYFTGFLARYFNASSFNAGWLIFAVTLLVITLLKWLLFSIYFSQFVSFSEILINLLSSIMFYPIIAYINIVIQNKLLPQERINE